MVQRACWSTSDGFVDNVNSEGVERRDVALRNPLMKMRNETELETKKMALHDGNDLYTLRYCKDINFRGELIVRGLRIRSNSKSAKIDSAKFL